MYSAAGDICTSLVEINSIKRPLGNEQSPKVSEAVNWTRDTWFTPPRNSLSKLPVNMYGLTPPASMLEKLVKLSYEKEEDRNIYHRGNFDFIGWCILDDGRWYNVYTGNYSDVHPYAEETNSNLSAILRIIIEDPGGSRTANHSSNTSTVNHVYEQGIFDNSNTGESSRLKPIFEKIHLRFMSFSGGKLR